MKKIISAVILCAILLSSLVMPSVTVYAGQKETEVTYENNVFPDTAPELTSYSDVSVDNWEYNAVYYTEQYGLLNGIGGGLFGGKINITRGSVVTVLGRAANVDISEYQGTSFSDVSESAFYAPYVKWASENGIVNGYSKTLFGPNDSATRQDIACILFRFASYIGRDVSARADDLPYICSDYNEIAGYALDALSYGYATGLFKGTSSGGTVILAPKRALSRSEMAQLISVFDYSIIHEPSETFYLSHALTSNMVIQRNAEIKVWGFSATVTGKDGEVCALEEGKSIIVEFKGSRGVAFIEEDGSWSTVLSRRFSPDASSGNSMIAYSDSGRKFVLDDVLVGDVFVNAGQSNMWVSCEKILTDAENDGLDYYGYIDDSDELAVRLLRMSSSDFSPGSGFSADCVTVYDDFPEGFVKWQLPSEGCMDFSAIGYVFATNLYKESGIPVGMIQIDASGNPLSAFCPEEVASKYGMERHPRTDYEIAYILDKISHNPENFADCYYVDTYDYMSGSLSRWAFNMMINPILNFNCSGLLWYQGESDQNNTVYYNGKNHAHYAEEFAALMTYLRNNFNNKDGFPVVFCEYVSCYKYSSTGRSNIFIPFGVARSENSMISKYLVDSYVSPSADIWYNSEMKENIHPYCKPFQAFRMLDIMRARVFGIGDLDTSAGAVLTNVEYDGNTAILTFDHINGFLAGEYDSESGKIIESDNALYGIEIMRSQNVKNWTKATGIEVISSNQLKVTYTNKICGVRYNADDALDFGMSGKSNICDENLLPIVAFSDYGN